MSNKLMIASSVLTLVLLASIIVIGQVLLDQRQETNRIKQQVVNLASIGFRSAESARADKETLLRYNSFLSDHEKRLVREEQIAELLVQKLRLVDEEMEIDSQQINSTQKYLGIAPDAASIAAAKRQTNP